MAEAYKRRTALPFIPAALTFRGVEYSVPLPPVRAAVWLRGQRRLHLAAAWLPTKSLDSASRTCHP